MQDAVGVAYGRVLEETVEVVRRSATFPPAPRGMKGEPDVMTRDYAMLCIARVARFTVVFCFSNPIQSNLIEGEETNTNLPMSASEVFVCRVCLY